MSFLWANILWLLFLVPVLVAAYMLAQRRRQKYVLRYASLSLVREALGRGPGIRRHIPPALFLAGIAVMIVAIARPTATVMLPSEQGTVILTLDVSGSMRAEDLKPTRLEAAKAAARTFVEKQPKNVRIGIVSFSESAAILQMPTTDRDAVMAAINRLTNQRRTAIGSGILTSLDAIFEEQGVRVSPQSYPSRDQPLGSSPTPALAPLPPGTFAPALVVLLSDGQSNTGPRPLDIIEEASDRGVRVYTVGIGNPEGTVLRTEGFAMRVRLDEETLKGIAKATSASYFKAESETNLSSIYEDLSKKLVFHPEKTEITAFFAGGAAFLMLAAGSLSMLWFNRLP